MRQPWMLSLALLLTANLLAQKNGPTPPPTSDPQAVVLAGQALAALTQGKSITDVTLSGTATWNAGSQKESGSITLKALGTSAARIDFSAPGVWRSEINAPNSAGVPGAAWIDADGVKHAQSEHNCWIDAVWFFPALSSLAKAGLSTFVAKYLGPEAVGGVQLDHVQVFLQASPSGINEDPVQVPRLSRVDIYLDPESHVPLLFRFDIHPDNDAAQNLKVEVRLSAYARINGLFVPMQLQKLINNTLLLDTRFTSVAVNSGLSVTDFSY